MNGYETIFKKLLWMVPEETGMSIALKTVKDDFDSEE